jgi:membrane protein YqaA with SNARE-associated domain
MGFLDYPYFYMFLSSFGAATLLPIGSEPVYLAYLAQAISPLSLTIVASIGNILGGIVNYYTGIWLEKKNNSRKMIDEKRMVQAKNLFDKYGGITLLFSWVFIIGDPLTVVAGALKYPFPKFLVLMSIGKILRFVFLWAGFVGFTAFFGA